MHYFRALFTCFGSLQSATICWHGFLCVLRTLAEQNMLVVVIQSMFLSIDLQRPLEESTPARQRLGKVGRVGSAYFLQLPRASSSEILQLSLTFVRARQRQSAACSAPALREERSAWSHISRPSRRTGNLVRTSQPRGRENTRLTLQQWQQNRPLRPPLGVNGALPPVNQQ